MVIRPALHIADLPAPTPGRTGWPWTVDTEPAPFSWPSPSPPPRMTVVTPSFNQCAFLEETIRSVLLQNYPNLEYLVMDGGSTDGSVEVIQRYAPLLDGWVSEPDQGQSDAINKGWARASGSILAYLNSDDTYLTDSVVASAAQAFGGGQKLSLVHADCIVIDAQSNRIDVWRSQPAAWPEILRRNPLLQPAAFMSADLVRKAGFLDPSLHFVMDYDLWLKLLEQAPSAHVPKFWAGFRLQPDSKSIAQFQRFTAEKLLIINRMIDRHPELARRRGYFLAGALLQEAEAANQLGDVRFSVRQAINAWRYWPPICLERRFIRLLLKYLAGGPIVAALRRFRARRRLARNPPNLSPL